MNFLKMITGFAFFYACAKFVGSLTAQYNLAHQGVINTIDWVSALNAAIPQLSVAVISMLALAVSYGMKGIFSSKTKSRKDWNSEGQRAKYIEAGIFIAIAAIIIVCIALGTVVDVESKYDNELLLSLKKESQEVNKRLPRMIDNETRFDWSEAAPEAKAIYYYTFIHYPSSVINSHFIDIDLFLRVKSKVCNIQGMQDIMNLGGSFIYVYSGNDGVEVGRFEIWKKDCNDIPDLKIESIDNPSSGYDETVYF